MSDVVWAWFESIGIDDATLKTALAVIASGAYFLYWLLKNYNLMELIVGSKWRCVHCKQYLPANLKYFPSCELPGSSTSKLGDKAAVPRAGYAWCLNCIDLNDLTKYPAFPKLGIPLPSEGEPFSELQHASFERFLQSLNAQAKEELRSYGGEPSRHPRRDMAWKANCLYLINEFNTSKKFMGNHIFQFTYFVPANLPQTMKLPKAIQYQVISQQQLQDSTIGTTADKDKDTAAISPSVTDLFTPEFIKELLQQLPADSFVGNINTLPSYAHRFALAFLRQRIEEGSIEAVVHIYCLLKDTISDCTAGRLTSEQWRSQLQFMFGLTSSWKPIKR